MKKIISFFILLTFNLSLSAQTLEPISLRMGKLNISVDPSVELLGVIQTLADYPLINKDSLYSKDVRVYFESMKDSKAVEMTKMLLKEYAFAYDAPYQFMLHLSQPPLLEKVESYSEYLKRRAGGEANLELYRIAIDDFSEKSGFAQFWASKKEFYEGILASTEALLQGKDLIKTIEEYYKDSCNSYNLVVCPLFGNHNYGGRLKSSNGKLDVYAFISISPIMQTYGEQIFTNIVLHEFNHSFVTPLIECFYDRVMSEDRLLDPIMGYMSSEAYISWDTVLNEHFVRAIAARMMGVLFGGQAESNWIQYEKNRKFVYIEPIVESLKNFEKFRDADGVTFAEYFPDMLSDVSRLEPVHIPFDGCIDQVFSVDKIVFVYPTADCNQESNHKIKEYVSQVVAFFKQHFPSKESFLIPDSIALNKSLSEYGIVCYGTIESNLFLSKYKETFPFQIKDNTLFADKEYRDPNLRFITCLPNPQNFENGMIIYTALTNANVLGINNYHHGDLDYHIFGGDQKVLSEGRYVDRKSIPWKFIK